MENIAFGYNYSKYWKTSVRKCSKYVRFIEINHYIRFRFCVRLLYNFHLGDFDYMQIDWKRQVVMGMMGIKIKEMFLFWIMLIHHA